MFATFRASMTAISPLIPEMMSRVSVTFRTRWQKLTYLSKYLSKYLTKLYQHFRISKYMYGYYKNWHKYRGSTRDVAMFINLFWGLFGRRWNWPPSLFALTFQNKMQYRFVNAHSKCSTNAYTLHENVIKIGSVT